MAGVSRSGVLALVFPSWLRFSRFARLIPHDHSGLLFAPELGSRSILGSAGSVCAVQ